MSRQVAASGRRQVLRAFKVARATHFGTVLVAEVRARAQSRAEVKASILSVREQHATRVAQEAISDTRARARAANMRVVVAAMRRSEERLRVLSAAIDSVHSSRTSNVHLTVVDDVAAMDKYGRVNYNLRKRGKKGPRKKTPLQVPLTLLLTP